MKAARQNNAILWWALLGFTVMLSAWTVLFVVAAHHRVAEVPLVEPSRRQ